MASKKAKLSFVILLGLFNVLIYTLFVNPDFFSTTMVMGFTVTNTSSNCSNNDNNSPSCSFFIPSFTSSSQDEFVLNNNNSNSNNNNNISSLNITTHSPLPPLLTSSTSVNKTAVTLTVQLANNIRTPIESLVTNQPVFRVDSHNYSYILNEERICSSSSSTPKASADRLLMIFVCSSLANFDNRKAIRETWGSVARNSTSGVRFVFLFGSTTNASLQKLIEKESYLHSDIVQGDFLDTYNNLTTKSMMMLKWATKFCPEAKFILKTDDDTFVNVRNLVTDLTALKNRRRMLFGYLFRQVEPVRSKSTKWFVPWSVFKDYYYPDYLSGTAYCMSMDVAQSLYTACIEEPLFYLEDVFITGMCAQKAGIHAQHHSGFDYSVRPASGCEFQSQISGHRVQPNDMRKIWAELNTPSLSCL